ncbi:MAG: DNA repair protein RecO [Legionellales bacterium]|nr:DNA repair protein RecO [Legionellales bacterium]
MTLRVKLESCFILHRKQYRENSYIIDIFSKNHGKIKAITRGIAKNKKALIQPFTPCYISWSIKTDLASVSSIEARGISPQLVDRKLLCAFYINELIMKAIPSSDPHPDLFLAYENSLSALVNNDHVNIPLRIFEKILLDEIGYGLPLIDIKQDKNRANWYEFSSATGFIPKQNQTRLSIATTTLLDLYKNEITTLQGAKECKMLMQFALDPILAKYSIKSRMIWAPTNTKHT